ncbi:MAG: ATP-dependent helicase RecG, partial [Frankiaceae bacterium]|nr:ATP-dependent helicase RecG [Frankiaceae bacterium]
YREMLRSGKEPPTFEDSGDLVRAVLPGGTGNDAFVRFVSDLPDALARDVEVLLALSLLRRRATIGAEHLGVAIQRGLAEAQSVLRRLDDAGLLEPTRRTVSRANPTYRLRPATIAALAGAVTYRRRLVDESDRKVIEHVREYGHVTNRTLQRIFDVNVPTARNMLSDLRARGLLVKMGAARGGPGVRYGPGPEFPEQ